MATDTCKFCACVASFYDEPNCSTLQQAYEQTPARPYGCSWFDAESRKLHPRPPAALAEQKSTAGGEK